MIRRLRKYFIIISLASILCILAIAMASINIYNYSKVNSEAEMTLDVAIDQSARGFGFWNGQPGAFEGEGNPSEQSNNGQNNNQGQPNDGEPKQGDKDGDGFVPERIKNDNFLVVRFNDNGEIIDNLSFSRVYWIEEKSAREMAINVFNGEDNTGRINEIQFKKENRDGTTYVAFVDLNRQLQTANRFLCTSFIVAGVSFLVLGGLIVLASFIIFKPSEQAYQKQKKFITNASHELKTPLTIINTDLEIIEMDNGANEWTDSIKDQVNRLTVMTNQLVTLSRLDESNKENYPFEVFSLSEIVNKSIETFIPLYEKQGLSLKYDISEDIDVKGNESLINQLIYILLDNANKYAKDGGTVSVSLSKNNKNQVCLSVSNDIEENSQIDVGQVFDRFYRAPTAKTSGSGIGLSIASEIVKLHKGQIAAHIENNKIYFEVVLK